MPEREMDMFSNPLPPMGLKDEQMDDTHPLTNEDFRKMLMTPRGPSSSYSATISQAKREAEIKVDEEEDAATRRKKKKSYYAKLKRDEEERQKELASKYRDRARERRDGQNRDEPEQMSTTADYRAVAPDAKSVQNYAERRKQMIQESKYLGGDMEHTHLVKGLDYALLDKVRAEISSKEKEEEDKMEMAVTQNKEEEDPEEKILFKTKLGRNIYRTLFKNRLPERNELFLPKRMAYAVDLEDEYGDFDIPNTIIRSKVDCPSFEATTTLTTNDIVINKLTQILSYLRQGKRELKKLKKKEKGKLKDDEKPKEKTLGADDSIYGEIGEYMPSFAKPKDKKERGDKDRPRDREDRDRDKDRKDRDRNREHERDRRDYERDRDRGRDRGRDRERERGRDREEPAEKEKPARKPYFEKPAEEDEDKDKPQQTAKDLVRSINDRFKGYADIEEEKKRAAVRAEEERLKKLKAKTEIDSYAECYPGMMESADAIDDSDEEADYTKMDQGNKKGPVGRWDFDTQEEYSSYMSSREALPKAAFQYGVKMSDGRKTRRAGPKDEKSKLDRELQQINKIIEKRKAPGAEGSSKKPKY
ncbi:protein Red-like isoform X1 [Pomacea canaliculata]|uniref:protein Red-like isoform X1 n=1 Tax=Pomacea canaliculata TaxID=400727 RepID=UPI000D736A0D|nr:protein Red-like isoform X1 [Pomacea canaliculata]